MQQARPLIKSSLLISFLLIIYLLSLENCANVVTPTGGEKDTIPPAPVYFNPENYSTNFQSTTITIRFDEYVALNDAFNQVLISPPLDEQPEFKLKGKSLNIEFKSPLKDSTTYTINFGQSIKDITESNILENFTYVFSTGKELDSLSVSGTISDQLTNTPSKSVYALLYLSGNDSSFISEKPYYFAKADESGKFIIKNIREGNYKLYALEDQNFDYHYDLPNENIAFQNSPLFIDTIITNQKLKIFSEDRIPQNITEIRSVAYGETRITFAKPAGDVRIRYMGNNDREGLLIYNTTKDTLLFFHPDYHMEKQIFEILFEGMDTIRTVEMISPPDDTIFIKQKNTFSTNLPKSSPSGSSSFDLNKKLIIQFTHPVKSTDDNLPFKLQRDSFPDEEIIFHIDSLDPRKLIIDNNLQEGVNYKIYLPQNKTKDIFGLPNDSITLKFTTKKKIDYALLTTEIENKSGENIIIQFLSADLKTIIKEVYLPASLFQGEKYSTTFDYLVPGIYKLRAIIDLDKNGKWTTGNLSQGKQPEPVYFFPVDQNLRANWETKIEWVLQ